MINDEIFARMGELSPAEKRVARTLLSSYPSAGLESATALAKSAGTSTPTVLRLVSRLGIGSYPEFKQRLREEIANFGNSPLSRPKQSRTHPDDAGGLQSATTDKIELIERLTESVPPSEFDRAVEALSSKPRHVAVSGGYFTRYMAMLLASQLDQVIGNVDFVADPVGSDAGQYLRLSSGSVAIILDFRPYALAASEAANAARRRGATVIIITDHELSPAADAADIVLPVPVAGVPFDSVIGLLALLEAIVETVLLRVGERSLERMKSWQDSMHVARVFRKNS
jgi:DNA-binding MurR/RpiR family transcriptional regulator